jgi:hypothetical protein
MLKKDMEIHLQDLHIEVDEANERLSNIWELHEKSIDSDYCAHCMYTFPCPTIQAFFLCDCCDGSH